MQYKLYKIGLDGKNLRRLLDHLQYTLGVLLVFLGCKQPWALMFRKFSPIKPILVVFTICRRNFLETVVSSLYVMYSQAPNKRHVTLINYFKKNWAVLPLFGAWRLFFNSKFVRCDVYLRRDAYYDIWKGTKYSQKNVIFDPHIYKDWLFYVSYTIEYHMTMPWVVYKSANVAELYKIF